MGRDGVSAIGLEIERGVEFLKKLAVRAHQYDILILYRQHLGEMGACFSMSGYKYFHLGLSSVFGSKLLIRSTTLKASSAVITGDMGRDSSRSCIDSVTGSDNGAQSL